MRSQAVQLLIAKTIGGGLGLLSSISMTSIALADSIDPSKKSSIEWNDLAPLAVAEADYVGVDRLSDVQPTNWAFQALQQLIDRYGCLSGYPDGSFRGDRPLSRYEFAASLNHCLDQIQEQIKTATASPILASDLIAIERIQEAFAPELATLRGRVDALEAKASELESQQFSTTTRLTGQVIFAVTGAFSDGDITLDPDGRAIENRDPNATLIYRTALDFNTSFSGADLLKLRIDVGNGGDRDNAAAVLEPTFGSGLDFSAKPPTDGTFGIGRLYYSFRPWPDLTVSIGPEIRTTDYIDLNRYANLSFRDFSTQALVNNYILFPVNGPSAGAAIAWRPKNGPLTIRAFYAAADPANSSDRGPLRGTAPFTRLIYPLANNSPDADLGDRGLFGDTYQGAIELDYAPSKNFALRLQYTGGQIIDRRFHVFGANFEYAIAQRIGLFGRYGYGSYDETLFGDLNPQYWMAGISLLDLGKEGAFAGLAVAQPFIESEIGDATQTNIELFYNWPVNDNIRITPVIQVITNASNRSENDTAVIGTLRTVFSF